MAYLNLDLDYFDHPKTKRLVGLLGRGSDGLPVRLWCYCGKYHADTGHLTGYSPTELESLIGWWGRPGQAIEALVKLGFLEHIDAGFAVHDWGKINGHISAFKLRAQLGAAEKWRRVRESANAEAMLKHRLSNAASNALTLSSSSLRKEEEEKKRKNIENKLNSIGAGHLMPAKANPPTLEETRRRLAKAAKIDLLANPHVSFFDDARKAYPGSKGGLIAEWKNFESKCIGEIAEALLLLLPAINKEIEHKSALKAAGLMVPQWKNFQTWINKRCWEQEFSAVEVVNGKNGSSGRNPGAYESAAQRNARKLRTNLGLDQPPRTDPPDPGVVLPLVPQGATGTGNAGH